jgi:hypothetical protein
MAKSDWEPANGKPLVKIIDVRKEVWNCAFVSMSPRVTHNVYYE